MLKVYLKMKHQFMIVCLAGAVMLGVSACGDKKAAQEPNQSTESATAAETQSVVETAAGSTTSSILDAQRVSEREDYVGLQDLNIDDYVVLNDYKNMKVTAYKPTIEDADIESYINSNYLTGGITDRAVENGDVVNIDYEGKEDGVAFEGGTASGAELEIGSGSFIPGFEEGLIGVMPGDTTELNLSFPEDYRSVEHAGKEVVFTVKVNSIAYSVEYANVTSDDMKRLGLPYSSKEELWEAAKTELEQNAEDTFEANKTSAILNQCLSESTVKEVPEHLVEEEIQNYEIYMESMCQMYYGMGFESYLSQSQGITLADFEEDIRSDCEETVKKYLLVEALARAEGIEITDEMIREHAAKDIEGYEGYTVDTYLDEVGYTTYRIYVLQEMLVERLFEIISVEPTSEQ
ncbi:MAG: trigger factor [Lachnospiraceae bacterium]|nr:trigger factor [Lachnospiraceae bacterium]